MQGLQGAQADCQAALQAAGAGSHAGSLQVACSLGYCMNAVALASNSYFIGLVALTGCTHRRQMLDYTKGAVTRNASEKKINSLLDFVSTSTDMKLLQV